MPSNSMDRLASPCPRRACPTNFRRANPRAPDAVVLSPAEWVSWLPGVRPAAAACTFHNGPQGTCRDRVWLARSSGTDGCQGVGSARRAPSVAVDERRSVPAWRTSRSRPMPESRDVLAGRRTRGLTDQEAAPRNRSVPAYPAVVPVPPPSPSAVTSRPWTTDRGDIRR